jgi:hypothetical protein
LTSVETKFTPSESVPIQPLLSCPKRSLEQEFARTTELTDPQFLNDDLKYADTSPPMKEKDKKLDGEMELKVQNQECEPFPIGETLQNLPELNARMHNHQMPWMNPM